MFNSKKELLNWLEQKPFTKEEKQKLLKTVKRKERYYEKFSGYEESKDSTDKDSYSLHLTDANLFLNSLQSIENAPIFRLILKIVLNININYLNSELTRLQGITINLETINSLKKLYDNHWSINKGEFFKIVHETLGKYSPEIGQIRSSSIQQRVIRDFKKIGDLYERNEFHELILSLKDTFYLDILDISPVFLTSYSTKDFNFTSNNNTFNKLKAVDLSNNKLEQYPFTESEATNIEYVNLSGNSFTKLPDGLYQLKNPKVIVMRGQRCELNQESLDRYKKKYPKCKLLR